MEGIADKEESVIANWGRPRQGVTGANLGSLPRFHAGGHGIRTLGYLYWSMFDRTLRRRGLDMVALALTRGGTHPTSTGSPLSLDKKKPHSHVGRKENRMKENVVANATREEVHNASRLLVEVLNERKEMGLELLKEETGMESDILSWAIGWLVRDDMVEVIPNGGSYSVRRKEPDTSKPILI
jgi:hypothetical protein